MPQFAELSFAVVLVICRTGGCMMLLPGFGSNRLPMRIKSMLAIAVSLALSPILFQKVQAVALTADDQQKVVLIFSELLSGISFGLLSRLFIVGLQFSATIVTNMIGLAPTPGVPIDDTEVAPPLVTFISLCGTMMVFATNMHIQLLGALVDSYDLVQVGAPLDFGFHLDRILATLSKTSELGLRLSGPFIVYSIVVNLTIGFVNKFTAQISVYFLTTGLVAAGGLVMIYFTISDWLNLFSQDFIGFFN
jgi:flagellar biosynthesis protein FliR